MRVPRIVGDRRFNEGASEFRLVVFGVVFLSAVVWALAIWKMADILAMH
jgi:hypothetical protein